MNSSNHDAAVTAALAAEIALLRLIERIRPQWGKA